MYNSEYLKIDDNTISQLVVKESGILELIVGNIQDKSMKVYESNAELTVLKNKEYVKKSKFWMFVQVVKDGKDLP